MMMVCIADANAAMGRGVSFSFVTTAEELDAEPEDCRIEGPVEVTGEILHTGEAYRLTGCVRCERKAVCDRCLEHFSAEESYAFDEEVRRTDDESGLSIVDDKMDISPLIRDTLLVAQPIHNVCRPDCLGLCPKCGANLNAGECGCDRAVPDPRLAALEQLLKKQKI